MTTTKLSFLDRISLIVKTITNLQHGKYNSTWNFKWVEVSELVLHIYDLKR